MSHSKLLSTKNWLNKPQIFSSALLTLRTQVFTIRFLIKALTISFIYLVLSTVINEFSIYSNIFSHQFDLLLKLKISVLMFAKSVTMFGSLNTFLLLTIALIVGINSMLVIRKIAFVRAQKNVQWTFGAGFITLASTSCPGCGFSLLSVTGLTTAIPGLPLQGLSFSMLILAILTITTFYNLQSLGKVSCALPSTK